MKSPDEYTGLEQYVEDLVWEKNSRCAEHNLWHLLTLLTLAPACSHSQVCHNRKSTFCDSAYLPVMGCTEIDLKDGAKAAEVPYPTKVSLLCCII